MVTRLTKIQEDRIEAIVRDTVIKKFDQVWMNSLIAEISTKVEQQFQERLRGYEDRIVSLENEISALKSEKDQTDQFLRCKNIRIFGLEEKPQESLAEEIGKLFCDTLKVNVKKEDIEDIYRTGPRDNGRTKRQILVKLSSERVRNEVYRSKKLLKGSGITIREDLTKPRRDLLKVAIETFESRNVWTQSGKVYVYYNNKKNVISTVEDLNALT